MVGDAIIVKKFEIFCLSDDIEPFFHPSRRLLIHGCPKRGIIEETSQRSCELADIAFGAKKAGLQVFDDFGDGSMEEADGGRSNGLSLGEDHSESFFVAGRRRNARITQDASTRHAAGNFEWILHAPEGRPDGKSGGN